MKRGDTIYGLALKYGTKVSRIMYFNNLKDPRRIRAGRTIVIPVRARSRTGRLTPTGQPSPKSFQQSNSAYKGTKMLPVKEAIDIILAEINDLGTETIEMTTSAGRVLAEDVTAGVSNPPWDNSAMDGYALRAATYRTPARRRPPSSRSSTTCPPAASPKGRLARVRR